jgi:hypothetical protein
LIGPPLSLLFEAALVANGRRGLPLTRARCSLDNVDALSPIFAEAGRRAPRNVEGAEHARPTLCHRRPGGERTSRRVWRSHVRSAPSYGKQVRTHDRLLTMPGIHRRKKRKKPLTRSVCLLTTRGLIRVRPAIATKPAQMLTLTCTGRLTLPRVALQTCS